MDKKVANIEKSIRKQIGKDLVCSNWHSSILLEGEVDNWSEVILAGKIAANKGFKGVVNRVTVKNLIIPEIIKPKILDNKLDGKKCDVLIIGGGVIGCAIARELSKWKISVLLVDKEEDLAMHSSSRNDGMVHPGIEPKPGTKKAFFNVKGNELYSRITKELNVPFKRCGSNVLFDNNIVKIAKPFIMNRAKKNGVKDVSIIDKLALKNLEPNVLEDIKGAIHFGTTGVLSPYKLTVAYGENAVDNGVEVSLNTIVTSMKKDKNEIISVITNRGKVLPKVVINAAGVYSDHIANMVDDQFFTIHPRKGQILILDKKRGNLLNGVVAKPSLNIVKGNTKGGGVVKTIEGNLLIGPDAYEEPFKEDYSTDREHTNEILKKQLPVVPKLSRGDVITYFSGTRAATYEEDFIIEKSDYVKNLIHVAGIQSPGLASAPAIAEEVEKIACGILAEKIRFKRKEWWNPIRKSIPDLSNMSLEERSKIIKENPNYGIILCRCEEISKGEIIDAINSKIPVRTLDGIKRRVRAGMGRCQGGFCTPLVMKTIVEETGMNFEEITKKGQESNILVEPVQKIYEDENFYGGEKLVQPTHEEEKSDMWEELIHDAPEKENSELWEKITHQTSEEEKFNIEDKCEKEDSKAEEGFIYGSYEEEKSSVSKSKGGDESYNRKNSHMEEELIQPEGDEEESYIEKKFTHGIHEAEKPSMEEKLVHEAIEKEKSNGEELVRETVEREEGNIKDSVFGEQVDQLVYEEQIIKQKRNDGENLAQQSCKEKLAQTAWEEKLVQPKYGEGKLVQPSREENLVQGTCEGGEKNE